MNDNTERPVQVTYSIEWSAQGAKEHGTFEIPRDEWNALTPAERTARIDGEMQAIFENAVGYGWTIPDTDDEADLQETP